MTALTIDRLTASGRSEDPAALDTRLRSLLQSVADRRLDDALAAVSLPDGHWCIRRIDLRLPLDLGRPDAVLAELWARELAAVISRAVTTVPGAGRDVVFYRRPGDALADLLVSTARGDRTREWAWAQLGLVPRAGAGAGDRPTGGKAGDGRTVGVPTAAGPAITLDTLLTALGRYPRELIGALVVAIRVVGAAALHRLLGRRGWSAVARIAASAAPGGSAGRLLAVVPDGAGSPAEAGPGRTGSGAEGLGPVAAEGDGAAAGSGRCPAAPRAASTTTLALARQLVAASTIGGALRGLPITVDRGTAREWAVVVALEAAPSTLQRADADAVLAALADLLTGTTPQARGFLAAAVTKTAPAAHVSAADSAPESAQEEPGDPSPRTPWAGLLFLLNTADAAAIPELLHADPVLGGRPPWQPMAGVLTRLAPVAVDDPAVLTLCGLRRPAPAAVFGAEEVAALDAHALRWATVTADRLGADDEEPATVCERIAARAGTVVAEPGWIEVLLRADEVDVDVRRAGLDLNPDWVPWLGAVVRFRYD